MPNDAIPALIFCELGRLLEAEHGWINSAIAIAIAGSTVEKWAEYLLAFLAAVLFGLGSGRLWLKQRN